MLDQEYNIESGILEGKIGIIKIHVSAGSGGRAGSTTPNAVNPKLANIIFATDVGGAKNKGIHNYGTLPRGVYTLKIDNKRPNWIRLIPQSSNIMHERSGFAIHGRGKIGSHGCIVPSDPGVGQTIIKALKKTKRKEITLQVVSVGQLIRMNDNYA